MNDSKASERIKVAVRCRPLSEDERSFGYSSIVKINSNNEVEITDPNHNGMESIRKFNFDIALGHYCKQSDVYEQTVRPLVNSVLMGFNSTIFSYGQSGSGKTYTMEGSNVEENGAGIISRAVRHIFDGISKSLDSQYLVRVTYLEIYQDEIRDLLSKGVSREKCEIKENKASGVYVKNITAFVCNNLKQINAVILAGKRRRATGYTNLNERSSRSHAVLTITVEMKEMVGPLENTVRVGKLNLVDLAGSERLLKSNAHGVTLKEANKINLSLTALGNVISALTQNKISHIPYRDSKLTRLLQDSLGGNSKTLMIANIGPASIDYYESMNTLRFASRVSKIKNKPRINEDPTDALLRMYQEEIKRLRAKLQCREAKKLDQRQKITKTNLSSFSFVGNLQSDYISEERNEGVKFDQEYFDNLTKRVELLESQLLYGSSSIIHHTNKLQETLNRRNGVIRESIQREKDMQEILELKKETTAEIQNEYSNLSIEIDIKRNKLKKIYQELEITRQEITNAQDKFNSDRQSLNYSYNKLVKAIKLKFLIVDNFIPQKERRKVLEKLHFHTELKTWKYKPDDEPSELNLANLKSVERSRRLLTMYTLMSRRKADYMSECKKSFENEMKAFRYKGENIIKLQLALLPKTTRDYVPPIVSPATIQHIFGNVLSEDDQLIDAGLSKYSTEKKINDFLDDVLLRFTKDKNSCRISNSSPVYPKARGLVQKTLINTANY